MNTQEDVQNDKAGLRRAVRTRLAAVTPRQRETWSQGLVRRLMLNHAWDKEGGAVALFGGLSTEPDLLPLLPWLRAHGLKPAFFAVGSDGVMRPRLVREEGDLVTGPYGVLEPDAGKCSNLDLSDLVVVLVPGLAFSPRDGARLGRGKGFYDRVLASPGIHARFIGTGFALQMLSAVPREPHDVPMHALVSEEGLVDVAPSVPGR